MSDWKNVCCAVDFADESRLALQEAASIARRSEGELTLVHVFSPPPVGEAVVVRADLDVALHDEAEARIEAWREEAGRGSGRPARAVVLSGTPAEDIVRFARERRCDLIVVGTHGRRGVGRLFLGSVAEKVVRAAPCSVLVVRRRAAAGEGRAG